jgi:hypothetical protein
VMATLRTIAYAVASLVLAALLWLMPIEEE